MPAGGADKKSDGSCRKDVARNNLPSSAIGRYSPIVPAGQGFIEDDAQGCQKVRCDFFAFDVDLGTLSQNGLIEL